ncbi:MAG: YdeI/OmpD-associated family protein [Actinomycetota bacterium]|nr:YdeI/OmpD-associated family protein [Actinomycetota bacterium]
MADLELTAAILEGRGPAGAFVLSDEQVAELGGGVRTFPVRVSVGGVTLALRVARMGGESLVGLSRAAREQAGVEIGASYDVTIAADTGERTVEVPGDLAAALAAEPDALAAYGTLAYSRRKELVRRVVEAKREVTRAARVAATIEQLLGAQKD